MVTLNRLTGHSPGFLSVYTLPPNQAVTVEAQRKINARRRQTPPRRDFRAILSRKSAQLLARRRDRRTERDCSRPAVAPDFRRQLPRADSGSRTSRATDRDVAAVSRRRRLRDRQLAARPGSWASTPAACRWRCTDGSRTGGRSSTQAFVQFARLLQRAASWRSKSARCAAGRLRLEDEVVPCGVRGRLSRRSASLINEQRVHEDGEHLGRAQQHQGHQQQPRSSFFSGRAAVQPVKP